MADIVGTLTAIGLLTVVGVTFLINRKLGQVLGYTSGTVELSEGYHWHHPEELAQIQRRLVNRDEHA